MFSSLKRFSGLSIILPDPDPAQNLYADTDPDPGGGGGVGQPKMCIPPGKILGAYASESPFCYKILGLQNVFEIATNLTLKNLTPTFYPKASH
jgi:hypothetical protein